MARRLPPLTWLRAFEAAARHLSITRAAEELQVTPAVVSQHVSALEKHLHVPLFRRVRHRLFLTDKGENYLPKLREAFDLMALGTRELYAAEERETLTIRVPSSFSIQWLAPKLDRFHARYPRMVIRLSALGREADFAREEIDLEIRNGAGKWPGVVSILLLEEEVFPVCSPQLLTGPQPLRLPADLRHHQLLHVNGYREDWRMWFAAAGVEFAQMQRGDLFDQSVMAIQAAVNGLGVALGRTSLVANELAAGRLVAPFAITLPGEDAYWITYPESAAERPGLVAFRDWLLEEAYAGRNAAVPSPLTV
jgi:LysR family glycine cleavage system transcriptional activator